MFAENSVTPGCEATKAMDWQPGPAAVPKITDSDVWEE